MFTKLKISAAAVLISLIAMQLTAAAQDYEKGSRALIAGDYATALKEFKPLAEQGDTVTQTSLGFMYRNGKGVPQDYAKAV